VIKLIKNYFNKKIFAFFFCIFTLIVIALDVTLLQGIVGTVLVAVTLIPKKKPEPCH